MVSVQIEVLRGLIGVVGAAGKFAGPDLLLLWLLIEPSFERTQDPQHEEIEDGQHRREDETILRNRSSHYAKVPDARRCRRAANVAPVFQNRAAANEADASN